MGIAVRGRPGGRDGRGALVLLALFGLGCPGPGGEPERVVRLPLADAGTPTPVEAAGETRWASWLPPGSTTKICSESDPAAEGVLELGVHAADPGLQVRLRAPDGATAESVLAAGWTDLSVPVSGWAGGCAELSITGPAGFSVAVSTPLWLRSGPRRPWVVLYVVDTFRFDDSPFAAEPSRAGPAFARLADDGILYRRGFSVTSWTRPTVASLLTGVAPAVHQVLDRQDRVPGSVPRLPALLAAEGWSSVAISTNPNILPVWGFLPGFDRFVDVGTASWVHERGFAALRDQTLSLVEAAAGRPLFLYVHDNEPHLPYKPLARYREMFGAPPEGSPDEVARPEEPDAPGTRALYRAAVRSTSDRFGELVSTLKRVGRYEDALIVLVGDHGEEFGDHGGTSHGRTLFQEQLHVPLVVKPPGGSFAGEEVEVAASLEDVAPTILTLLGIDAPAAWGDRRLPAPGEPPNLARPVVSELNLDGRRAVSAILWPWKYLRMGDVERVFDLSRDPGETTDLAAREPDLLAHLRALAGQRQASGRNGLWLTCTAGRKQSVARVQLRIVGQAEPSAEGVGLEARDRVETSQGSVVAEFHLRPAEAHSDLARFDPILASRAQADRDALRVGQVEGEAVEIRTVGSSPPLPSFESADGSVLSIAAGPIPLSQLAVAVPPPALLAGTRPRCLVYYVNTVADSVPEESVDPAVRERLRALGYLE